MKCKKTQKTENVRRCQKRQRGIPKTKIIHKISVITGRK